MQAYAAREAGDPPIGEPLLVRGDHDLNPDMLPDPPLRQAAVLVPLVERPGGLTILLTQRTDHLPDHAGQISFPGGSLERDDTDPCDAALRETEEEIGLHRRHIEIIGGLDLYITRTGYSVHPVVGMVTPPFDIAPDPHEVASVFEVPLRFITDPASRTVHSRRYAGKLRQFYAFPWQDTNGERYIWGATAGMLVNLCEVLDAS
ncbi:MAG: CoA pyrophosphatase [Alphaproteobacteria bacterium]|nr:CoA pyrophosphatase [Alphaproteobacteria bacterium]